ncbi:hypothetical protein AOQ84DRAFT_306307 [Glonium stellatum]|uniref:RNA polymerase II assembly factor Rtp1 C-terminal domain-containing protein n=1 Tax=Glonium stellatum TaxID=574774 RepID=A0A8E2JLM0_9PEZI|nr:hypothetical protein AOQ84DRAFT_306307 [Glonium stellatum]
MPNTGEEKGRGWLVKQALTLLLDIHQADQAEEADSSYDGMLVGIVYGLIDFVILQGILPSLSSGVAFARRPRSVLVAAASTRTDPDYALLVEVATNLLSVFRLRGVGIEPLVSQRALPDIISAVAELGFSPNVNDDTHVAFQSQYTELLDHTPTSRLFPVLSSFVHQDTPPWLRSHLSRSLSLLPLRPHGVRQTIEFISLSHSLSPPALSDEKPQSLSQGPPISLEAIIQASKLLSLVPKNMKPEEWFDTLAPQLWDLIDGEGKPEMGKAAGHIIASGILGRKSLGAPGMTGWKLFAEPILHAFSPPLEKRSLIEMAKLSSGRDPLLETVLVPEEDLMLALKRLATITSSHPHPGFIRRLVSPILLPLWGMMDYARLPRAPEPKRKRSLLDSAWVGLTRTILLRYFRLSADTKNIDILASNILWDGESTWTYGPGSGGGIEIRYRRTDKGSLENMGDMLARIERLDERVSTFVGLLSEANVDDGTVSTIFLNVTRRWLLIGRTQKSNSLSLGDEDYDPLEALCNAKLSEAMARELKQKFAARPEHIMELIKQLLEEYIQRCKSVSTRHGNLNEAKYASLGDIVHGKDNAFGHASENKPQPHGMDPDSEDLVSFSLSLLNALVSSSDFQKIPEIFAVVSGILPFLQYLSEDHPNVPKSSTITRSAADLIIIITSNLGTTSLTTEDPVAVFRTTLNTALTGLTSSDPPSRAWALSNLRAIITNPACSTIIDVPSTTHLILSASITDSDSYVYTAAVPVLVALATTSLHLVTRILADAFLDVDEQSLDLRNKNGVSGLEFRLRIGEAINGIVLENKVWDKDEEMTRREYDLQLISEATLTLASRRGQRPKTLSIREEAVRRELQEREEGEKAWGGPIPVLYPEEKETTRQQEEREALERVVKGWEDTAGEEDVRVRTSALSILGLILEHRLEMVQQRTVDMAVEIMLSILVLETDPEKSILRRAATLISMSLLRGMDKALEQRSECKVGLETEKLSEVERVLKWAYYEDLDDMVRDYAGSVLEELATWRMKSWLGLGAEGALEAPRFELEGRLRGLAVNPQLHHEGKTQTNPKIEEIE